jgi:hypothetical protein
MGMETNRSLPSIRILPVAAALAGAAAFSAHAQSPDAASGASRPGQVIMKDGPNYTEPVVRLQQAAQKLRESIQNMAQQPAGPRRNQALDEAREALLETQSAMVALPPELRTGASGNANYTKSMERLQEAAQRLRDATQAMAQQPAGGGRNDAIRTANEALFDVQQAMLQLPPEQRSAQK